MPNEDDVLINFIGDTSGLQPVENALEGIIAQSGEVGTAWEKASTAMNTKTKGTVESTNKLVKGMQDLATAAKSMDKVVIGAAYGKYLKDIQQQLGLTNKEVIAFVQNARLSTQQQIFAAKTDAEVDEITMSIEAMNEQLVLLGAAEDEAGGKTQTLKARLREAKEELVAMAEAGLQGTPAFAELQKKAGELDDQMRDLNATVKNVGSDTKNIEGLISLASGLAGGFAVAQGAAALFGNGEEEIQKALLKVNAAMSILQGLQQIQNVLQKESAAMLLLADLRTKALAAGQQFLAVTTLESAAATGVLRGALLASGIGAIVVLLGLAATAFSNMNTEIESSTDRMERLTKKADAVYEALQKVSKVNQFAVDREVDITKNKELVSTLEAQGASIATINAAKKIGIGLDNDKLKTELMNIESAKEIAADKNQFVEKELEVKSKIYSNDQQQLILDIETNKVLSERALKSAAGFADAEVARKKLAIVTNQIDSIASIKAVSDAEINAIRRKQAEELRPGNGLTPGEIAKINADAELAISENKKTLQQDLLKIETAGIEARVLLSKKGSEEEYNNKLALLEKERTSALANNKVTADDKLRLEADFTVKKRDLDRAYDEQKLQDEISYFNTYIDEFGITEDRKLELTLRRLNKQRDLEISQAEGNAAKIKEINARFDAQERETKKASIVAELEDRLKTIDAYGAITNATNERILAAEKSTFQERKNASLDLLDTELNRLDLEERAETKKFEQGLILEKDYLVAIQLINNQRSAASIKSEEEITAATLREIEKRATTIKGVFSLFQKGLSATMDVSGLTVALTELQNFGATAENIFAKIKAGTITSAEGMKELAGAAIGAMQSVVNQVFADNAAARQQALSEMITALEDQKTKELDNKNLTEEQKAAINKKFADKERQVKIEAFKADKEAKKEQAIINGFLAVTQAFATNPFPYSAIVAGIVALSVALQVSAINRAKTPKFRHGKVDIDGPGTTTSDSIPAMISRGESVINADATAKWKDALEAINSNKFEHYLLGKIPEFIIPQLPEGFKAPSNNQQIDYKMLAKEIANEIRGIIPGDKSVHVNIDKNGIHTIAKEGNSRTEYKNKRYSMT
jgi:hypothetical protein